MENASLLVLLRHTLIALQISAWIAHLNVPPAVALLLQSALVAILSSTILRKNHLPVYVLLVISQALIICAQVSFTLSLECHSRCSVCTGASEGECSECLPEYWKENGKCYRCEDTIGLVTESSGVCK